jgi:hypothetical protein
VAIPPLGPAAAPRPVAPAPQASAPARTFGAVLEGRAAGAAAPVPAEAASAPPLAALEGIERARRRLDAVLEAARRGRTFTAQELLGLQAEAYRYTQTVDLAAKLVESGAQSVKQALNTQI